MYSGSIPDGGTKVLINKTKKTKMNYNNLKFLAYTMAIYGMSSPYFMGEKRSHGVNNRSINITPIPKTVFHEFSIHGVKIMARSKRDAIKKYNHKYR